MKKVKELKGSCYYVFESLASGRTCYFENENEIKIFKELFREYMDRYVEVHKIYFSSEGYHIVVKLRERRTLLRNYVKGRENVGKGCQSIFIEEPWRIVSEQIRKMCSLYVRKVNKLREREGVLVKKSYSRWMFENEGEMERYIEEMEKGREVESQRVERYRVSDRWKVGVDWGRLRGESTVGKGFHRLVLQKLVRRTIFAHLL